MLVMSECQIVKKKGPWQWLNTITEAYLTDSKYFADATKSVLTGPLNFQEPQEDITVPKYT